MVLTVQLQLVRLCWKRKLAKVVKEQPIVCIWRETELEMQRQSLAIQKKWASAGKKAETIVEVRKRLKEVIDRHDAIVSEAQCAKDMKKANEYKSQNRTHDLFQVINANDEYNCHDLRNDVGDIFVGDNNIAIGVSEYFQKLFETPSTAPNDQTKSYFYLVWFQNR